MIVHDVVVGLWSKRMPLLAGLILFIVNLPCLAQPDAADSKISQRWAVIFVGLPGDAEHEVLLRETANSLQTWLTDSLEIPAENMIRHPLKVNSEKDALTTEKMSSALADLKQKLQPEDSLWVFLLGHGNFDGKRGWFHVAGKDPCGEDFGRWMDDIRCREQVIWLTQSSSGWFLKPLSRPGRIVIAATATDDESNETEFPHALANVAKLPADKLDLDRDNVVSVAELYMAVIKEVLARFKADDRLPTEHAQIDDNGDGMGTETIELTSPDDPNAASPRSKNKADGDLARKTIVPYRKAKPTNEPMPAK